MGSRHIDPDAYRPTSADRATEVPSPALDRVGRVLMGVNAVLAVGAFAGGVWTMIDTEEERLIVEGWRTFGFLAFAGFWALMALAPRRVPGVWELVLLHKTLMVALAFAAIEAPDARTSAITDTWLVVSTAFAYVVCRGWTSWRVLRIASLPDRPTHS